MSVPVIQNNSQSPLAGPSPMVPVLNVNNTNSPQRGLSLHDILAILARRKKTIFFFFLMTLLASLLFTILSPASYRANATIQIERKGAEIVTFGKTEDVSASFDSLNDPFFRTRYEMLKSRRLAQKVINELHLQNSFTAKKGKWSVSGLLETLGLKTTEAPRPVDYSERFLKKLLVQPIEKTHLVEIYYDAPSADEAKAVVSSLINNFIRLQIETKSETGEYAKNFLSKQLKDARERLTEAEAALVKYSNDKGILGIDAKQTRHVKKLENLNAALVNAEIKRTQAESLYRQMEKTGSVSSVLTNPVISNLKANLVKLESDYQEKSKTFKSNYPDMVRLRQQINTVRSKLNAEMANIKRSMESDYLAAKRQEGKIRYELKRFNKKLYDLQDNSIDYNTLKREVDTSGQTYNSLLKRLEEVNVASAANTSSIRIVDPVVKPVKQYRPQPLINLLVGSLAGLIFGLGFAFLREAMDRSVRTAEDLQNLTGLPVLASIPHARRKLARKLPRIVCDNSQSAVAEAYRILSANIRFMAGKENERVMLITSGAPGEGKSTTASSIACAYAQMGLRVLLVDADLRKPSIHEKLGLTNKSGLTNFLVGKDDLVGITQSVKEVPGLYAISSGTVDEDPVSLLSHERMAYLTTQAATRFDYVILDAPPAKGFADTLILSSLASSTLIVAQQGQIDSHATRQILEQLTRVKNNVIGFLMINTKNSTADQKFYSKYYRSRAKKGILSGNMSGNNKENLAHLS